VFAYKSIDFINQKSLPTSFTSRNVYSGRHIFSFNLCLLYWILGFDVNGKFTRSVVRIKSNIVW